MPRIVSTAALCALSLAAGLATAAACSPGDPRLAGHYYLNGVMEVGSELLLRPNGSFEFMLAYGANDQYGKGCWVKRGATVEVIPAGRSAASRRHTPDDRSFGGLVLTVSGRSLVWNIAGSGYKGRYER
ncbi:hypothetical protein N7E70_025485 [Aminobacter sp. NyZ550]|jgi:hypothetical protein|uniref:hypothetical protein n=1 Tax=Aminobacter sp. NyZ550 TaxID=2979870 RepID=UPI0021D58C26|nr:hypothetical protein [Aminobacter sp. NyZ550]WAX94966.1 hypothetical protein N7E70_025485 [Aminobacter sp. NyZ550]